MITARLSFKGLLDTRCGMVVPSIFIRKETQDAYAAGCDYANRDNASNDLSIQKLTEFNWKELAYERGFVSSI